MAKPDGKHLLVMLGMGGRPDSGGPPPRPPGAKGASAAPAAEDDLGGAPEEEPEPDEAGEKVAPERALYAGPEEVCGNCENWVAPNACSKVDVVTDRSGRCWSHFEPKGGGQPAGPGGMPMMPPTGAGPTAGGANA